MRKESRGWVLLLAVVALLTPAVGSAGTFGAEVFGAYNRHAMNDANDMIDGFNASGAGFDQLTGGLTGGLGLRMWASPNWSLSGVYEPLRLETTDNVTSRVLNLNAKSLQFTAARFFPSPSTAKYGIGAGVGYYNIAGSWESPGQSVGDIDGSGMGFHFMGLGEWQMGRTVAFTASAGYRHADIEVKDDVNGATANYSGVMARAGLAFYMPSK